MKLDVKDKKENKLLSRTEVTADLAFDAATPSNKDVQAELAKKLSVEPELVIIKKIATGYGTRTAGVTAYAYTKKDDMMKIEGIEPPKEEPKAEEAKKEEPKKEEAKDGKK